MHTSRLKTSSGLLCRVASSLALASLLAACGYKGPLYMPPPAPDESLTTPPAPATMETPMPETGPASTTTSPITPQ